MSGHSKWSSIKHAKAITDNRRGKVFTKLAKEIIVVARQGGGDPDTNFKLRMAIQRGKDVNMPADTITRAIKKGTGESTEGTQMAEVLYEGYGPGGTAILLEALTDNRNRTASDVRSTFTKAGGNLAEVGAVAWQFAQRGVVVAETDAETAEDLAMVAIDAGADDFEADDATLLVYSSVESLETIRRTLSEHDAVIRSSELSMMPNNTVTLNAKAAKQTLRLLDKLEDLEDVQRVYSNGDFPDEVLEEYGQESG
jgi:YebC/PmpR family DNA-binding regulatory protein